MREKQPFRIVKLFHFALRLLIEQIIECDN